MASGDPGAVQTKFQITIDGMSSETHMSATQAIKNIKIAIESAPQHEYVAELHVQIIKYADVLNTITGKEFTEELGIGRSFGTEFSKMRKIAQRLVNAGLDTEKI